MASSTLKTQAPSGREVEVVAPSSFFVDDASREFNVVTKGVEVMLSGRFHEALGEALSLADDVEADRVEFLG